MSNIYKNLNHYVVYLKLLVLEINYTSIKKKFFKNY